MRKFFILQSYEAPHIYAIFTGSVNKTIQSQKGVFTTIFSDVYPIYQNVNVDYIHNYTYDVTQTKKQTFYIFNDESKESKTIEFRQKYRNLKFHVVQLNTFLRIEDAQAKIIESMNLHKSIMFNMIDDINKYVSEI